MRTLIRLIWHNLLRLHVAVVGPKVTVDKLMKAGRVTVGPHTYVYGLPTIRHFILDETKLKIGDYCSISNDAIVYLGGRHKIESVTTYPHRILWNMEGAGKDGFPTPSKDSEIGSDVWLCPGSHVLSGVRIGHGAIVGAGSVVTKDVPDYAIVGGNPARVISYRHTEEQRAALLEIAWWDWPEDEVKLAVPLLADDDIDAFIAYARERFPKGVTERA